MSSMRGEQLSGKGDAFMIEAENTLNKTSIFSFMTNKNQKYEDAAEAFTKAG